MFLRHASNPSNFNKIKKIPELNRLAVLLEKLSAERDYLSQLKNQKAEERKSCAALSILIYYFKNQLIDFNPEEEKTHPLETIQTYKRLVDKLIQSLATVAESHDYRNALKKVPLSGDRYNEELEFASLLSLAVLSSFASQSLLGSLCCFFCFAMGYQAVQPDKQTLFNLIESSLNQLKDLKTAFIIAYDILSVKISVKENNPDLTCPITNCRIQNPALCILDTQIYEADAIRNWLYTKPYSPVNHRRLRHNQTIDDVLMESSVITNWLNDYCNTRANLAKKIA